MSSSCAKSHVLLQGFNWNSWRENNKTHYKHLQSKSKDIKETGIDAVWFPPPIRSVSPQGYMPLDMYNLDSQYGSEEDLRSCIDAFHYDNIDVFADIILNHRCAEFQNEDGVYNVFGGEMAWDTRAIVGNQVSYQGEGKPKQTRMFEGAPNIDHSQEFVREDITKWLKWLKDDVKFDGFRLDFVLGMESEYFKEYIESADMQFVVGEYWDCMAYSDDGNPVYDQNAHRQRIVDWMDALNGRASTFDMTTKGILQHALSTKEYWRLADSTMKPPGVIGWWPQKSVTFLDNHDTHWNSQNLWPFPNHNIRLVEGYSYLLTHPGTPMIYWDHFNIPELRKMLEYLIWLRKEYDISNEVAITILEASDKRYMANIDDKLCLCIGAFPECEDRKQVFRSSTVCIYELSKTIRAKGNTSGVKLRDEAQETVQS